MMNITVVEKKMTKVDMYEAMKAMVQGGETNVTVEEMVAFIDKQIEQVQKKNAYKSPNAKPSVAKEKNAAAREVIYGILSAADAPMAAKDFVGMEGLEERTSNSIAQLLGQLVKGGQVAKGKVKGVTVYAIAAADAE